MKTIIAEVSKATGDAAITPDLITHVQDRKGHDRRYGIAPDITKKDIGGETETMLATGIVKTIHWYLDNPQWVEHVTSGDYQAYYETMYANKF